MNRSLSYLRANLPAAAAMPAALLSFVIYAATSDSSVSYWDCPEYVLTASSLQVGHPPGNPVWTLAMRVATLPFAPQYHARVINICSGLFMALAIFFLVSISYRLILYVLTSLRAKGHTLPAHPEIWSATAAALSGICFAVLDSTWFSAVEAEVYALSTFLTAFTIWLMLKWADSASRTMRHRLLILIAYVLGLSLGVHQLNLLCLPVLAMIFVMRRHPDRVGAWRLFLALAGSFLAIALILLGMMPGVLDWIGKLELLCVNRFRLPYFSGVAVYIILIGIVAWGAVRYVPNAKSVVGALSLQNLLWLSGIFLFHADFLIALVISILVAGIAVGTMKRRNLLTAVWMLLMLLTGYSAIGLILVRGYASTPVNEGAPGDPFSLQRYAAREQYGSKPLIYGPTPFSRPMFMEVIRHGNPVPDYSRYSLIAERPRFSPTLSSPRLLYRSRLLTHADSIANGEVTERNHGYLLTDYRFSRMTTPELNMWFPRITSGSPYMMDSYADWAGMTVDNMEKVEITTAIDSAGNSVGKLTLSGERMKETAPRPTYLQNLRFFLTYQVGYMYLRYLMWNFVGRQNDIPSTGEIDHGNVVTGLTPLDKMMMGDTSLMPSTAADGNPGRHVYYAIPFLLGIIGIIFLLRSGSAGRRVCIVVALLFLMTGVAIVVYLNQDPGEPRERDYAFIGSYMAFCIWIAFGMLSIAILVNRLTLHRKSRYPIGISVLSLIGLGTFTLLAMENWPDHDRSGRFHTRAFALSQLAGKENDIIFSYGDNFTFPLWYAQEVEGAMPGAAVVDVSYLATPEYVLNLLKQGDKGIRLTASPADIAFGAYSFTAIAPDADTVPAPMIDILKTLYASGEGNPTIRHTTALLPGRNTGDTLRVNLRNLATASGMIPFRTLMLLDIIATNLEQPRPRPISFLTPVKGEIREPVKGALVAEGFSDTYAPGMTDEEYLMRLRTTARAIDSTASRHKGDSPYTDAVIDDQIRRQRGALVRTARELLRMEKPDEARLLLTGVGDLYPATLPGSYTVADSTFHETLVAASLLTGIADSTSVRVAGELLRRSRKEAEGWKRYYYSLPAWRRTTVSNSSRRLITTLPLIDSLQRKITVYNNH